MIDISVYMGYIIFKFLSIWFILYILDNLKEKR